MRDLIKIAALQLVEHRRQAGLEMLARRDPRAVARPEAVRVGQAPDPVELRLREHDVRSEHALVGLGEHCLRP